MANKKSPANGARKGARPSPQPKKMTRRELEELEARKIKGMKIALCVFAAVALVAVVAIALIEPVSNYFASKRVDYLHDNLGKYITLDEADYRSYEVELAVDDVTDMAVENSILQLLCSLKDKTATALGVRYPNLTPGDVAYVRYRGYTLNADGDKVDFDGGCNFSDTADHELELGSGGFIAGFELGLVGTNPLDHGSWTSVSSGDVAEGDLLYISYTALYPDGAAEQNSYALVDLGGNAAKDRFGEDFRDFFLYSEKDGEREARQIGGTIEEPLLVSNYNGSGYTASYSDIKIVKSFRMTGEPLTLELSFPKSYSSKELAGKEVFFDVYVMGADLYDAPEYNDALITEELKLTAEDLKDYEGATLADKYRECVRESLEQEREAEIEYAIQEAMWEHYIAKTRVKKLPQNEVKAYYNQYLAELESSYDSTGSLSYSSFDEYAAAQLGLEDPSVTWQDVLTAQAESTVTEKLILFYLIDAEDLTPSEEEYQRLYDATVERYLESYLSRIGCTRDKYSTDAEYEAAVERHRTNMLKSYDEDYFPESVYFEIAFAKLREYAVLK